MAEMAIFNLEIEKDTKEQAEAYFKLKGTDLAAVLRNVIHSSDWDDLVPSDEGIVYLENGDWYDSNQISHEEYEKLIKSMEYSEANPDEWYTIDEAFSEARRVLHEKIRSKNERAVHERYKEDC